MKHVIISVDVEPDWFDIEKGGLSSLRGLNFLQDAAIKHGMPLTYLVTYECAVREEAVKAIRNFMDSGMCEVGHHLHVWSTPPLDNPNPYGVDTQWIHAVQSELSDAVFDNKMKTLHDAIKVNYGTAPRSHRAGRWGQPERPIDGLIPG